MCEIEYYWCERDIKEVKTLSLHITGPDSFPSTRYSPLSTVRNDPKASTGLNSSTTNITQSSPPPSQSHPSNPTTTSTDTKIS